MFPLLSMCDHMCITVAPIGLDEGVSTYYPAVEAGPPHTLPCIVCLVKIKPPTTSRLSYVRCRRRVHVISVLQQHFPTKTPVKIRLRGVRTGTDMATIPATVFNLSQDDLQNPLPRIIDHSKQSVDHGPCACSSRCGIPRFLHHVLR